MPWPKGYTRAQVAAMSPAERKEVFRKSNASHVEQPMTEQRAKAQKQPREQQRAIPEEQPRPQQRAKAFEESIVNERATVAEQPTKRQRFKEVMPPESKPTDKWPAPHPEALAYANMKARKPTWTMKAGNNWETASQVEENPDRYHVPRDLFPEGMDLQWCTETVYGQDMPQRMNKFYRSGWTPVHGEDFDGRFAGMFPQNDGGFIKLDGMVLCARPLSVSLAAKERDKKRARDEIALKAQAFTGGEINATGANHPSALAKNRISRTMERIDIPRDD